MSLPAWMAGHQPATTSPRMSTPAWSVAHWTADGIVLDGGAHDRDHAQRLRDDYVTAGTVPASAFVVPSRDVR